MGSDVQNCQMPISPHSASDKPPCIMCRNPDSHLLFLKHLFPALDCYCRAVLGHMCFLKGTRRLTLRAEWDFHMLSVLFSYLLIFCSRYCFEAIKFIRVKSNISYLYVFLYIPGLSKGRIEMHSKSYSQFSSWHMVRLPEFSPCREGRQPRTSHAVQRDPQCSLHAPLQGRPKIWQQGHNCHVSRRPQKRADHCKCLWSLRGHCWIRSALTVLGNCHAMRET